MTHIDIRIDDLSGDATRALIALHLEGMHATSPPESVHALDADRLRDPAVTFWSAWIDGELAGHRRAQGLRRRAGASSSRCACTSGSSARASAARSCVTSWMRRASAA